MRLTKDLTPTSEIWTKDPSCTQRDETNHDTAASCFVANVFCTLCTLRAQAHLFWWLVPLLKLKPLTPARLQFILAHHQVWEPRRLLHWCTLCWGAGLKLPYCSLRFWLELLRCEATLSPKDDHYGARALFIERNAQKHNPYINCKCKQCEERDYFIIKSCYRQIWKTHVGFCQKQHQCNFVWQVRL